MRVFAVVVACLACTGHGRRVRTTIHGPSGFREFTDGPVSGYAGRGDSEFDDVRDTYGRRGRSQFNDARHGYVRRGDAWSDDIRGEYGRRGGSRSDDIRGEYGRRGNSWSDGIRGEFGRREILRSDDIRGESGRRGKSWSSDIRRSELDDDFRYSEGRRAQMTRRGRSLSQDFEDEYDSGLLRRGSSLHDNVRGGYGRRGRSEFEDDFRFGDKRHGKHMTTLGSSGYGGFRDGDVSRRARRNSPYAGGRSGHGRTGRSEHEEDFRYGDGRHQVHMPSGGSSGYIARTDENINELARRRSLLYDGARGGHERSGRLDMDEFDDIDDLGYVHGRRLRRTREGAQGYHDFRDGHVSGHSRRGSSWLSDMVGTVMGRGRSRCDDY